MPKRSYKKKSKSKGKKSAEDSNSEEGRNQEEGESSDESDYSEKEEDFILNIQQQLKVFPKIAALGQLFLKYTGSRRRKPQDRNVKVVFHENNTPKQISWGSGSRKIDFDEILYISWGHWTPVFQARKEELNPDLSFSIVAKSQTLDLYASNKALTELWVKGLRKLINQTDEQALELSKKGLENKSNEGLQTKKRKDKDKSTKGHKTQAQSLLVLQQDLFVMTTTTVFRNLEEERIWSIDQSVRDRFNPKLMYEEVLRHDVPWRSWNQWVRAKVVEYLKENGRLLTQNSSSSPYENQYTQPVQQVVYPTIVQSVPTQPIYQQPVQSQVLGTQPFIVPSTTQMTSNGSLPNVPNTLNVSKITDLTGAKQEEQCNLM